MFGVDDKIFLQNGVKVIDGIAGGGKSSKIDSFFKSNNMPYSRFTSTNRLRRDAMERYNMEVKTIAAGLFVNHGTSFYNEEKDTDDSILVIDEILQADPRALNWVENHKDDKNIIITTDSRQLLSPENEYQIMKSFNELISKPSTTYINVTDTLRPRNKKTKKLYNEFYEMAKTQAMFKAQDIADTFENAIDYSEMVYTQTDAYITHDNLTEDYLYKDKSFTNIEILDLVPKGFISSKSVKNLRDYPLLSQLEAERTHATSYTQVMNVGSPVRFQGSEVTDTQKLYFILQPTSVVSARELYTVISRMWDINSFVIVFIDTPKPFTLHTFKGLPVKTHKYLSVGGEVGSTTVLSNKQMDDLCKAYDTADIYYDRDVVRSYNGKNKYVRHGVTGTADTYNSRKSTAASIVKRDANLNYTYMDKVYEILDKNGLSQTRSIHKLGHHDDNSTYVLDIFSAHPTLLKFEKMPIDGILKDDGPHDDMLNFYVYKCDDIDHPIFTSNSIITDDMKNYITSHNLGTCEYLFSTPYTVGTYPGNKLYEKAHDTIESKKEIKGVHYGYYQKPYLKLSLMKDCYVRYENHIYELLICQIFSQLLYYMMQLYDAIDCTSVVVDAVTFNTYDDSILKKIHEILPNYIDFRIKYGNNIITEDSVIYQTYDNLQTKHEKKLQRERDRRKNMTREQKDARNARVRELRRLKKEAQNGQSS